MQKLSFQKGNAKLGKRTAILSLPAGHTCPGAKLCRSMADRSTGEIIDGKDCEFRCYATGPEAMFKGVRESRWGNYELLKAQGTSNAMSSLIMTSLPKNVDLVRIHQSGDFFSELYFKAWLLSAAALPDLTFYGYTKMIPYLEKYKDKLPANLKLVASLGGKYDDLLTPQMISAKVVFSEQEAEQLGLELDHDDTHAWKEPRKNFGILLHAGQPAGSRASLAWQIIKKKQGGYRSDYFKKANNSTLDRGTSRLVLAK